MDRQLTSGLCAIGIITAVTCDAFAVILANERPSRLPLSSFEAHANFLRYYACRRRR